MNGPTPGPRDAHTPSPWSNISGLETTEKHQTTICCLAWHLTHKTLSSYVFSSKASSYQYQLESKDVKKGEIIELTTTFLPAPGIDKMRSKGYSVWTVKEEENLIKTYFLKN